MSAASTLVAGGAGFLGSHLCTTLVKEGHEVYCLDNFGSGRLENIEHLANESRFKVVEADIRTGVPLPPVDEIYHLASRASPAEFTEFPVQIALANTEGTRNLLDHAVACGARMVYASTSEVYGDPEIHPQPESYTGNVDIRGPRGCYDESKRFGETLTVAYAKRFDIDVRTARIFNTYGPRMRSDDGRVVPTFVTQALRGENLTVHGDGSQTRSFCYVSDMVDALRTFMSADMMESEVLNLGNEDEVSINELAERVLANCETDSEITYVHGREGDPNQRCPDLTSALETLDWKPTVSVSTGISQTINYFREQL
jgi:UDP-glucuronate decarboxylase